MSRRLFISQTAVSAFSAVTTATAPFAGLAASGSSARAGAAVFAPVRPRTLVFPRDHGGHPEFRTEWWYLTAWLERDKGLPPMGLQLTFFRSRTQHNPANPSRFAPHQLLFAHLALALPEHGRLIHYDRVARVGPASVGFSEETTALSLDGWTFHRDADHVYHAYAQTSAFTLQFSAKALLAPVLRGSAGVSLKGPKSDLASHYYSQTRMPISLEVRPLASAVSAGTMPPLWTGNARGLAWLDHEWSSSLLVSGAVGWDWIGIHLLDGGSLMAFRIRMADGSAIWQVWDRRAENDRRIPVALDSRGSAQVVWQPEQFWQSGRSGARYPIAFTVAVGAQRFSITPLMQDQEVDARASTGGFYWEGAVVLSEFGKPIGRGYLELTGYAQPLKL